MNRSKNLGGMMSVLLKNGLIFTSQGFTEKDIYINKKIMTESFHKKKENAVNCLNSIDCKDKIIIPGFADVHVHFREPGFFYKESIKTGSMSAAAGGYTVVCTMPNLNPPPADNDSLQKQLDIIKKDAIVRVVPYGAITANQTGRGSLSNMEEIADRVVGFTDDGKGVQNGELMESAMKKAVELNKIIVAHCEDESLNDIPYMGTTSASESVQAVRDIELAEKLGCKYHICHVSAKKTVEAIRKAKARGVDVTAETAPHYLVFSTENIRKEGRFKMNPPIKEEADRQALLEGICDGTIDMIATDHAPHSLNEKNKPFETAAFGIVGLETAFGILNKELVDKGIITQEKLIDLMAIAPRKRFNLPGGYIEENQISDVTIIDPDYEFKVEPENFQSKGRSTPFEGMTMKGRIEATFVEGNRVW